MRIEFADDDIKRICTNEAHQLGLPFAVIKAARKTLVLLQSAKDERDLRNWKGLRYKKRKGDKMGRREVRVNDQYRIVFTITNSERTPVITILEIGDTH